LSTPCSPQASPGCAAFTQTPGTTHAPFVGWFGPGGGSTHVALPPPPGTDGSPKHALGPPPEMHAAPIGSGAAQRNSFVRSFFNLPSD